MSDVVGLGGLASFVFGSIPACLIYGFIIGLMPRIMSVVGALAWAWVGFSLTTEYNLGTDTVVAATVLLGAVGGFANFKFAAQNGYMNRQAPQQQAAIHSVSNVTGPDYDDTHVDDEPILDGNDTWQLAHALDHLLRARAIKQSTYNRAIVKLPLEFARVPPNAIDMKTLEREEVTPYSLYLATILGESQLISDAEGDAAIAVIETQISDLPDDEYKSLQLDGQSEESAQRAGYDLRMLRQKGDIGYMQGHLFDLAECRAISMDTFRRAIVEVDPDYDLSRAKPENFMHSAPRASAKKDANELLKVGLITRRERDLAHKAIDEAKSAA
ncbi:hypothetical protein [Salipiger sp. CCB-MM3]|uniref:hypothetical protein n=1 Tax=Salipiger sp. CCB-MM3 TaxID=1792508 RepID=UPI0012FC8267|nr:hypothetical protein [Salipiger sp. CCB-MM3]